MPCSRGHAVLALLAVIGVLAFATAATGKNFAPGDLRVCNARHCVALRDRALLAAFGSFYYTGRQPAVARAAHLRAPYFQLRFRNDYTTGIVATNRFDRFLSYGVNEGRFGGGIWYRVPPAAARALVRIRAALAPMRLTHAALARSE